MRMKEVIPGQFVYNGKRSQVERVRSTSLNGSSVVVTHHSDNLMCAKLQDLRKATNEEVQAYKSVTAGTLLVRNG